MSKNTSSILVVRSMNVKEIDRETVRRILLHLPSEQLEVIQETANAILDDRGATLVSPSSERGSLQIGDTRPMPLTPYPYGGRSE